MDNNHIKIAEMKCPGCGSALKMPPGGAQVIKCEYCGGEYAVNWNQGNAAPRRMPNWEPAVPPPRRNTESSTSKTGVFIMLAFVICAAGMFVLTRFQRTKISQTEDAEVSLDIDESDVVGYGKRKEDQTGEAKELTGMLREMIQAAFGKDANSVTAQELSKIKWVADRSDFDYYYIGYSFDDPLENPDAEIEWLTYPDDVDIRYEYGYDGLCALKGLKKLETGRSLSECNLSSLKLESLTANIYSLESAAAAVDDPSLLRELGIRNGIETLEGLEQFSGLERLSIYAGSLSDVDEIITLPNLTSLTLEGADEMSDFSVFGSMENLEELFIESENLKSLEFLKRMPQLKSLGIADGELLDLDGIEATENLEKLSVTDCRELQNMSAVESLTGLRELTLEKPYDCTEPSLSGLTGLQKLTLKSFQSCGFLRNLTELTSLTLQSCDLPSDIDLSGLTQLKELTCTTSMTDRSLKFVSKISSLESVKLRGMITYEDISGIFVLPNLKKLDISGIECEINFDKITENPSLESLEMKGIKLYKNVKVSGGGGIVYVDWDDVFLVDHLDFLTSFPNLKKLNIADNEIKELNFAEGLVKLEEIDFSDNYVSEMRPLAAIPTLKIVNCKGNPISNLQVLDDAVVIINK